MAGKAAEKGKIIVDDFAIARSVDSEVLARLGHHGILNHCERTDDGKYLRSVAVALIKAPTERVVAAVERIRSDKGSFMEEVNIINKFRILEDRGDQLRVRIDLKYRFFMLSFKFHVIADVNTDGKGQLDLYSTAGKLKDLRIHFRLKPVEEGRHSLFFCSMYFDVKSLGWLVDHFLRHHPEIELGVFSATAPVIVLTLKDHVERTV